MRCEQGTYLGAVAITSNFTWNQTRSSVDEEEKEEENWFSSWVFDVVEVFGDGDDEAQMNFTEWGCLKCPAGKCVAVSQSSAARRLSQLSFPSLRRPDDALQTFSIRRTACRYATPAALYLLLIRYSTFHESSAQRGCCSPPSLFSDVRPLTHTHARDCDARHRHFPKPAGRHERRRVHGMSFGAVFPGKGRRLPRLLQALPRGNVRVECGWAKQLHAVPSWDVK